VSAQEGSEFPALYRYCLRVYDGMLEEAEPDEDGNFIWKGALTRLILVDLALPSPQYTYTMQALKAMDCVKQLKRGGGRSGDALSEWVCLQRPTEDLFVRQQASAGHWVSEGTVLKQRIRDLSGRLSTIETELRNLTAVVAELIKERQDG